VAFSLVYGPPEAVPRYTKYPTAGDVLAAQVIATEWGIGTKPEPLKEIVVAGAFEALLVMERLPL